MCLCISVWYSALHRRSQIAKFMGPPWGPPGSCGPQMGPMLAQGTLLSGFCTLCNLQFYDSQCCLCLCHLLGWLYQSRYHIALGHTAAHCVIPLVILNNTVQSVRQIMTIVAYVACVQHYCCWYLSPSITRPRITNTIVVFMLDWHFDDCCLAI